ncbi:MAG: ribbon-helix-helix domain-containing protein [Promethearchaeota archaeon]
MKIVTVNVDVESVQMMRALVKEYGLYPSRSELVRVALREFLVRELERLENIKEHTLEGGRGAKFPPATLDMRTIQFARSLSQD